MQNDSNLQNVQPETSVSNAVLTPDQIHPNFFKMKKTHPHVQFKRQSNFKYSVPLSTYDVEHRKRWALRQMSVIANMPSTAVLGA
ncbi:hypothetical protein D9K80_12690 [Acinetobacter cumulans]|uniref:Uncharacterized protein n=1 Tax=Acinetobacter cumulans TaxID=2136182 RepID=A0A498CUA3_9GAMM|nr:hypothetical protein [Acinetobacter cumulans]RLL33764.1 hypothetical protein D9K80_12690 [Acinetobacter cumulans]